jgi:hypothetical protein
MRAATLSEAEMKPQILYDLHIDYPGSRGIPPLARGVDMVVVAGDTCQGLARSIESLRPAYPSQTEIVMVAGNHELWSRKLGFEEQFEEGHSAAELLGVRLLENSVETIKGIRILGCTIRLLSNPAGYAGENGAFKPNLVVEFPDV